MALVGGAADPPHRLTGDADVGALLPPRNGGAGTALLLHLYTALRARKERKGDCQHRPRLRLDRPVVNQAAIAPPPR